MRCPSCAQENRPKAKFCAQCGGSLQRSCGRCGADLAAEARFCDECGTAADAAPARPPVAPGSYTPRHLAEKVLARRASLEGERKQVTVLFADLAGFTALSTRLDPEDLHAVMDGCFARILEAVHRFEGTVNQFTGDGVMALFGAPIAHEDHALRAVAAALDTQRSLATYASELRRERGIELGLRIALNTGPVVVGKIGDDLRMDYTAQGETVNLAARLQAAADPGAVWISEATRRLAGEQFVTERRGPLELKGIERPVFAHVVRGARRRARFEVAIERGLTPFVGREGELEFLLECAARARGGRGQVVSIAGDAGIGKSRLAHELAQRAAADGAEVLRAGCAPHGESTPFAVIVDLLRQRFGLDDAVPESERAAKLEGAVASLAPDLAWTSPYGRLLLGLPAAELDAEGLDPAQRKRRTLEAIKAIVTASAEVRPLVLLVDDLQWADASSQEALGALVDAIAERRVLLVGTHRTGYGPPWSDRSFHQRIALDPLSDVESTRMAGALIADESLRAQLATRGEGNPYFLEEIAAYLRPGGEDPGGAERGIPETIRDLLSARIDRLDEGAKRALQRASVLGREFPLRLLEAISPGDEELAGSVATLVARELLHETQLFPETRLAFSQALVREVAYDGLLLKSRAELHAAAGEALERSVSAEPSDEVLGDLARHFARGRRPEQAVRYLIRAGDRAAALFAYGEACVRYREALALAETSAGLASARVELLDRIGDASFAAGDIDAALASWAAALERAAEASETAVELCRKRAVAEWAAGRTAGALAELRAGLDALGPHGESLAAARLYQELGRFHFRLGENEPARRFAEQALALGERLGAPDVISHAYNTLGVAEARGGDLVAGAATVQRSLDTALAHGLAALACRAYTNLAVLYTTLDHRRSAEYCLEGLALARRIGDQLQQSWLHCAMAGGHCTLGGDYDEGVRSAEAAIELDRRLGQKSHLPIPMIILAQIYQCRGDHARSAERYREALALAEEIGEPQLRFPCYDGLATLAIERGDETEADAWLARSREVQSAAGWSTESFFVVPFLC